MKLSLVGGKQPLNRSIAWGCLTSNVALPGSGSLMAGRRIGYAQLVFTVSGMILSTLFGIQFILWQLANWSRYHGPNADPDLLELWLHIRWTLAGFGLFVLGLLWALFTSFSILVAFILLNIIMYSDKMGFVDFVMEWYMNEDRNTLLSLEFD